MDKGPGVLSPQQEVRRTGPAPRLKLLLELEPAHRVFFRNLADTVLSRRVPPIATTSRPVPFWDDVFVPSGAPWSSFLESMLWHLLVGVLFVWGQSRVWVPEKPLQQRTAFTKSITYYPPPQSFPAVGGRASGARARSRGKRASAHQAAIPVTPQRKPSIVTPPDIKQAAARLPNFLGSHSVTPMVPFSATTGLRRSAPSGPTAVVAPAPQVDQATARRLALPQASAVAPAPELGAPSARRAMAVPNGGGLRVVPPPPTVQGAGNPAGAGRMSGLSGTGSQVVPPPPSVQGAGDSAGAGRMNRLSGAGSQVVPPPPSVLGAGNSAGSGRMSSLPGNGSQVVPPPPSVLGAGNSAGSARVGSLSGAGSQVVPPPPSVLGAGNSAGSGRVGSLSSGSQVVPPPPSVQGSGNSAGSTRLSSLSGDGSQVVPPPPSVEGAGNSAGSGRASSLSGDGSQVVPPPPSVEGAGNPATGGPAMPMDPPPVVASSPTPATENENKPTVEELSLGSIGLVFALPGSSYFSNYEVFVAPRRLGKDQIQLIKLVYVFLPYQRRLSEYDFSSLRPRHPLRAIKDSSCDETLGQMIQSHTDPNLPAAAYPSLPAELRSADLNAMLPCYRTTADDFQRAFSRAH